MPNNGREATLGVDVSATSLTDDFGLGSTHTKGATSYRWIKAGAAITAKTAVTYGLVTTTAWPTTTAATGGVVDAVADVAIASGSYGWVVEHGYLAAAIATSSAAAGVPFSVIAGTDGVLIAVVAVAESGSTAHAVAAQSARGKFLADDSSSAAPILLY